MNTYFKDMILQALTENGYATEHNITFDSVLDARLYMIMGDVVRYHALVKHSSGSFYDNDAGVDCNVSAFDVYVYTDKGSVDTFIIGWGKTIGDTDSIGYHDISYGSFIKEMGDEWVADYNMGLNVAEVA